MTTDETIGAIFDDAKRAALQALKARRCAEQVELNWQQVANQYRPVVEAAKAYRSALDALDGSQAALDACTAAGNRLIATLDNLSERDDYGSELTALRREMTIMASDHKRVVALLEVAEANAAALRNAAVGLMNATADPRTFTRLNDIGLFEEASALRALAVAPRPGQALLVELASVKQERDEAQAALSAALERAQVSIDTAIGDDQIRTAIAVLKAYIDRTLSTDLCDDLDDAIERAFTAQLDDHGRDDDDWELTNLKDYP